MAYDINDAGVMVGSSGTDAVIWQGGRMGLLSDLILDGLGAGWSLREARAINNAGQILGYAAGLDGVTLAFLLTPEECVFTPEKCSDGLDNDGDGLTDCADGDCASDAWCLPCFSNAQCGILAYCRAAPGNCGGPGLCEHWYPPICAARWDPVCGCDGVTYGNECEAFRAAGKPA